MSEKNAVFIHKDNADKVEVKINRKGVFFCVGTYSWIFKSCAENGFPKMTLSSMFFIRNTLPATADSLFLFINVRIVCVRREPRTRDVLTL